MEKLLPVIASAKSGDKSSKEFLIRKYKNLVHKLAHRYPHLDHEDLVQEGFLAVLDAVESYDEDKGASFFTWLYWVIRGRNTKFSRKFSCNTYSLDYIYQGEGGLPLVDLLVDEETEIVVPEEYDRLMDAVKIVRECTSNDRSYQIVSERVGLNGDRPLANEEVAAKHGISKQSVSNCMGRFRKRAKAKYPELKELI
jgi:RNA polymerase sigma factor (sigma-70 family)